MPELGNSLLNKTYSAESAIGSFLIVKWGSNDEGVVVAAAATDLLIGVTGSIAAAASGDKVDIVRQGITPVVYGGSVTRGQKLTANASGQAVAAAPSAGTNNQIIGIAEVSGVSGDLGRVLIAPSVMQG